MSKHIDEHAVSRESLIRRYAKLRGITVPAAAEVAAGWSRTDLRNILEAAEREAGTTGGSHARWGAVHTTTVEGLTR